MSGIGRKSRREDAPDSLKVVTSHKRNLIYEFGPFRIDVQKRLLLRGELPVSLTPKAFDMLMALVENSGEVIEKDELMKLVWPDQIVEEANLTVNMSGLRRALGESPNEHRYIVTVPGRGYQFVATVTRSGGESLDLILEEHTTSQLFIKAEKEGDCGEEAILTEASRALLPATDAAPRRRLNPVLIVLVVAALLLGLAIGANYLLIKRKQPSGDINSAVSPSSRVIKSVAVLPLRSLSQDTNDDYLGLGIADDLITKLSNIKQITVRPTSAVLRYSRSDQDPASAGRELGVEVVLAGSIRRSGERLRITVQLVNVADGAPIWAEKFDENFTDIFKVQDQVSEQVGAALMLRLTGEETRLLAKHYTENSEAHQLYMIGRYHWNQGPINGWKKAVEYYNRAIEKDPKYALAYSGLADIYVELGADTLPQTEAMPKARAAAVKALQFDDTLAEAHKSLGSVKVFYDWDWPGAEREFKRAIELSPNSADAHQAYGRYLAPMGRHDESIVEMKRAQELGPFSPRLSMHLGWALYIAREYDQAIEYFRQAIEMDPGFVEAHSFLGQAYRQKGMYRESVGELQQAVNLSRGDATPKAYLATSYAVSGRRAEAEKVLAELLEISKQRYVSPYYIAMIYAGLGDKDQAFTWLDKAFRERSRRLVFLNVTSIWDGLHADPRFADLLRRIGHPQ